MQDNTWVRDIRSALGWRGLVQYLDLWDSLATIELNGTDDTNLQKFEASGTYSTRSAYMNFFASSITFEPWKQLWKAWASSKCKTFMWLAIRNRCWTAHRLQKRGLPHPERCHLCDQEGECVQHILTSCVLFQFAILQPLNLSHLSPNNNVASFREWWRRSWKKLKKHCILEVWILWKHRNLCVFVGLALNLQRALQAFEKKSLLQDLTRAKGLAALNPGRLVEQVQTTVVAVWLGLSFNFFVTISFISFYSPTLGPRRGAGL